MENEKSLTSQSEENLEMLELQKLKDDILNAVLEISSENKDISEKLRNKIENIFQKKENSVAPEHDDEVSDSDFVVKQYFSPYNADDDNEPNKLENLVNEVEKTIGNISSGSQTMTDPMYPHPEKTLENPEDTIEKLASSKTKSRKKSTSSKKSSSTKKSSKSKKTVTEKTVVDEVKPIVDEPVIDIPVTEKVKPIVNEPVVDIPVTEEVKPIVDEPVVDIPVTEEVKPIVDEPVVDIPVTEEVKPIVDEPVVDIPVTEEVKPIVDEPVVDIPVTEDVQTIVDEPAVDEPVVNAPSLEDFIPVIDKPIDMPVFEDFIPVVDKPVVDEPVIEDVKPVIDEPVIEDVKPVVDELVIEDVKPVVEKPKDIPKPTYKNNNSVPATSRFLNTSNNNEKSRSSFSTPSPHIASFLKPKAEVPKTTTIPSFMKPKEPKADVPKTTTIPSFLKPKMEPQKTEIPKAEAPKTASPEISKPVTVVPPVSIKKTESDIKDKKKDIPDNLVSAHKASTGETNSTQKPVDLSSVVIDENCTDPIGGVFGLEDEKPLTGSFTLSEQLEDNSEKSVDDLDVPLEGSFDVEPATVTVRGKYVENTKPVVTTVDNSPLISFEENDKFDMDDITAAILNVAKNNESKGISSAEFAEQVKKILKKKK